MAGLSPNFIQKFTDNDGNPLAGGKIYTYTAGTTTPKTTYTDQTQAASNTNPIILDANGECNLWIGTGYYKFILKDANDVTLKTVDKIGLPSGLAVTVPAGGTTGQVLQKTSNTDYEYDWATPTVGRAGKSNLSAAVQQVVVTFSSALSSTDYAIAFAFENTTDADPIFLSGYISAKSTTGFTVKFNAPTDTANYVFHYTATVNA